MTPRTDCTWEIKENIQGKVGGEAKNISQRNYKGIRERF